ncbi:MAG: ThiF family adenylyltransferase [Myxococcales bacterium]|nr:ThiF family adenylyltransferase [Myxococcales bacterium]
MPGPRCLVIGAGALGGPIALGLASHGVALRIVDDDVVELSNLPRQIQFCDDDVGGPKVVALRERLREAGGEAGGPDIEVEAVRFVATNARRLLADVALIIDASDSPVAKFLACDQAIAHGVPYLIAAAIGTGGNLFIGAPGHACYRCLFEAPPDDADTCASAGVLAPICGIVAQLAVQAAMQLLRSPTTVPFGSLTSASLDGEGPPWRRTTFQQRVGCACQHRRAPLAVYANNS